MKNKDLYLAIAKHCHADVDTLDCSFVPEKDVIEIHVVQLEKMLEMAYILGRNHGKTAHRVIDATEDREKLMDFFTGQAYKEYIGQ